MARSHKALFYESELAAGGATEDIDAIFAALALEQVTSANERFRMEDVEEELESSLHLLAAKDND
jgi:hypothetical protein